MEGREENLEDKVGEAEFERTDNGDERRFKEGELVEFWDGPLVRGYRTDSGAPTWGQGRLWVRRVWDKNGWEYERQIKESAMEATV